MSTPLNDEETLKGLFKAAILEVLKEPGDPKREVLTGLAEALRLLMRQAAAACI